MLDPNLAFNPKHFIEKAIAKIRQTVGDKKVLCAFSGGVDSTVASVLTHIAVGDNLQCIFVDHGLLRKNETQSVLNAHLPVDLKISAIVAPERFLPKLIGVTDPEQKRKIVGNEFIAVFEEKAQELGNFDFLLQGTIAPDVSESKTVKSHHNVGGLPENMHLQLLEPLRDLHKDQVRAVGEALKISPKIVYRQPFPGPGLAIRCLGEVTPDKLAILREADAIVTNELDAYNSRIFTNTGRRDFPTSIWQYFAALSNSRAVGFANGTRTFGYIVYIRAVHSSDAIKADYALITRDILSAMSKRITEVKGVTRVLYDITSKPPGTIEYE